MSTTGTGDWALTRRALLRAGDRFGSTLGMIIVLAIFTLGGVTLTWAHFAIIAVVWVVYDLLVAFLWAARHPQ